MSVLVLLYSGKVIALFLPQYINTGYVIIITYNNTCRVNNSNILNVNYIRTCYVVRSYDLVFGALCNTSIRCMERCTLITHT